MAHAVQQPGFVRAKRGYKQIRGIPVLEATAHENNEKSKELPNDPLYSKQWYIVSNTPSVCKEVRAQWMQTSNAVQMFREI